MIRHCQKCGKEFKAHPSTVKKGFGLFCSKKCHYTRNGETITKQCLNCGKEFKVIPSFIKEGRGKYCSPKCRGILMTKEKSSSWKGGKITKNCLVCGKEFKVSPSHIKHGEGKHCSKKCLGLSQRNKITRICLVCKKEFTKHPSTISCGGGKYCSIRCYDLREKNFIKKNCLTCGKELTVWPYQTKRGWGKFCDKKCSGKWRSKYFIGEKSPGWQGGISFESYTMDWTRTLRRAIRERDHYTCQICGKEPATHCHHIDYNKKNCNPINLITLCSNCHPKTNCNREHWINYFKGGE